MTIVGLVVGAIVFLGLISMIIRLYRKVAPGQALVVTKLRSRKVSFTSALVLPIIHRAEYMDISVKTIEINRAGKDGLICEDNIRADISITFFVRVNATVNDVINVAGAIGTKRASDQDTLQELFNAKFSEAVKTVGKQLEFTSLYTNRDEFRDRIIHIIGTDLNGYSLEDAAIDYLEQTPMSSLDPQNILDAQGIRKITELTALEAITTNEHRRHEEKEIKRQNVEAKEAVLELERREEEAVIRQQREVETLRAREGAEVQKVQAEERLKSETARIKTEEATGIQHENRLREIAVAEKNRERVIAVETERIEKDRILEVVAREREEELARISANKELEAEKRDIADVIRERIAVEKTVAEQEEGIKRLRATEEAERERQQIIIRAEAEAQESLVKDIKAAEAGEQAAKHLARQRLTEAEADQQAAELEARANIRQAEGKQALAAAPGLAEVQVREAEADAIEKGGLAEAKAAEAKGLAEANAQSAIGKAEASATAAKGTAEADALRERLVAESIGLTDKAAAMDALSEASKAHEEYRLRLEMEKELRGAEIEARRSIAEQQAGILSAGLAKADISLVGGDTQFFDRVVGAIGYGKAVDGFMEHSEVAQGIAASWTNGSTSFADDLKSVLGTVGSDEVKNLTVSAALMSLMQRGGDHDMLSGLLDKAKELGVAERPAVEMTTR
ncbi:flotillin family protein [Glycomyces buryatensis]|uniref:Flotillin family protein n=1 Tax=Glycomyces buryatensis TaxID=2570927 RepID=A0A4S8QIA6_9ACTN|nr:flotillin family protein [Glycomyces buryatensis]THV42992.1 flotillin family protein [Glycomyces buryatensis]